MGALTDITGNASKTSKRDSTASMASMASQALGGVLPNENLGKKPPHFMSPTVSSSKQTTSKTAKSNNPASTPSTGSSKQAGSGSWMSSAAKRVGFSRVGDGTPRSKKEGRSKQSKAVSFPDKLAAPSHGGLPDSPASSTSSSKIDKATLDKPLPSPPIAQMVGPSSPPKLNRSLIDASEKPLRRSPPGKPYEQEEWPVLFPERPTTPGTLQAMAGQEDSEIATLSQSPQIKERYPLLPSSSYGPSPNIERKSIQQPSYSPKVQRKQVGSSNSRLDWTATKTSYAGKENQNPNQSAVTYFSEPAGKGGSGSPSKLASGAIGGDKSSTESRPAVGPRQTRTSSLRARLSAGQVSKDGPDSTKVQTFIEPTEAIGPASKQSEECHSSTSVPSVSLAVTRKPSKDSLHGRRPAQFVAGSRRPPSRGSLRSESRASSYSGNVQPPNRAAPSIPSSTNKDSASAKPLAVYKEAKVVPRKSSIPIFRQTIPDIATQPDDVLAITANKDFETHNSKAKAAPQDFGIYEDSHDNRQVSALGAIEESPRSGYHLKRLSVTSPQHGPTLKISPSADRLIMGTGSDKENDLANEKKKGKGMGGILTSNELRSFGKTRASLRPSKEPVVHPRPSSSQGLPLSASRPKLVDAETREKKVKSADIGTSLSIDHLMPLSGKETPDSSRKATTDASTSDDPFFDAQSSLDKRISRSTGAEKECNVQQGFLTLDNGSWVEPVQKHLSQTIDSDVLLLPADVQSVITHEGSIQEHDAADKENVPPRLSLSEVAQPKELLNVGFTPLKISKPTPSTPNPASAGSSSHSSGSHPPRSSSRTLHPNFTAKKLSPTSPLGNKEHVPQDFTNRQNRLGSVRGHGTSQVDFSVPISNRTSIAQESNKSHGSVSKGVLSKFGGLFHKRTSDDQNISLKSGKKSMQKVSITSNGSPFPPISEVHPIHRPTLSSMRRANGNAPRSPLPDFSTNGSSTPAFNSPLPTELSTTTTLAMQILESARKEGSGPKAERLIELGKVMVDAVTQARDAEKAMEEAKQAARKAEVAHALCQKSVGEVSKIIVDWRDELARGVSR